MSNNLLLQLNVESCAFGGDGVARHEGRVVFSYPLPDNINR